MCDQGGERIDVLTDKTATLRAEAHHPPCVLESAGFCTEHSANARGIGYEEEKSPTLRAGVVPAAIALENHPADSRVSLSKDDICQTLTSRCGTGGGNVPLLMETPKTLKVRCGKAGGGKGCLIQEDKSATLSCNNDQTLFVPKAYGICSKHSNSMMSDNPNSGFYEADTARTIDTSNQSPCKNQGGIVVIEGNGSRPSHHGDGYLESETMYTLNATEKHGLAYGIGRPAFNQGYNAQFSFQIEEETQPTLVAKGPGAVAAPAYSTSKASYHTLPEEEIANTLVASDWKDPPTAAFNQQTDDDEVQYIVRRLTPSECAKLQGFPSWWCKNLGNPNPSAAEIDEWERIFETFRLATNPNSKPKTRKAIAKFLSDPHSDSAEYKLWGNGISLPVAFFVLSGIVWAVNKDFNEKMRT
jgi:DNA (cytosine-5)-methyltransferase 1